MDSSPVTIRSFENSDDNESMDDNTVHSPPIVSSMSSVSSQSSIQELSSRDTSMNGNEGDLSRNSLAMSSAVSSQYSPIPSSSSSNSDDFDVNTLLSILGNDTSHDASMEDSDEYQPRSSPTTSSASSTSSIIPLIDSDDINTHQSLLVNDTSHDATMEDIDDDQSRLSALLLGSIDINDTLQYLLDTQTRSSLSSHSGFSYSSRLSTDSDFSDNSSN